MDIQTILKSAVVYPCCALHGVPIKRLANRFSNFVYIDYKFTQEEVDEALEGHGLKGYELVAKTRLDPMALIGQSWEEYESSSQKLIGALTRQFEGASASLYTFKRLAHVDASQGGGTLNLIYARAEAVSFIDAAYNRVGIKPICLAHIRSGIGFGGNYTVYPKRLSGLMRSNSAGLPDFFFVDKRGRSKDYGDYLDLFEEYQIIEVWSYIDGGTLSLAQRRV